MELESAAGSPHNPAGFRRKSSEAVLSLSVRKEFLPFSAPSIEDDDIRGVIAREIKQRKESVEAYTQAKRPDLAAKEDAEMAILKAYLPEQMNREEIVTLVRKIIAETGAQGPRDKNKVMPKLMPLVKGKADGQEVNTVVTELLGS